MIERNKIYCGDCFDYLPMIADKSVDLILTDMPYNTLNRSNPSVKWDVEIPLSRLWSQYNRIIKTNGAILMFGNEVLAARLIMSNLKMYRLSLIWDKVRKSNFLNCKKMPMRQHEQILVFYQKPPTYNPQMVRCEPHQRNHSRGNGTHKETNNCYGNFKEAPSVISDFKYPGTIVRFPKGHSKEDWLHPTAKPVNLLRYLIRTFSNEGDLVLDNFVGSGSTCIAAIEEKRDFIGIELSDKYYEIAKKRVEDRLSEPTLF